MSTKADFKQLLLLPFLPLLCLLHFCALPSAWFLLPAVVMLHGPLPRPPPVSVKCPKGLFGEGHIWPLSQTLTATVCRTCCVSALQAFFACLLSVSTGTSAPLGRPFVVPSLAQCLSRACYVVQTWQIWAGQIHSCRGETSTCVWVVGTHLTWSRRHPSAEKCFSLI